MTKMKFNTQSLFDNNNVIITRFVYNIFIIAININNYIAWNNKYRNIVRRPIVSSRQEIDFEINFIKLCKTKLNTASLWPKQVRKIESGSDFWSEIEKTISLIVRINLIVFDVEINFKISKFIIIHKKNIR